jgi:hypothetical protein
VVRDTYPNLENTTLQSINEMFPVGVCAVIKKTYPIEYIIRVGDIYIELLLLAIRSADDVNKLLSLNLTGIYCNELATLPRTVLSDGYDRTGRSPSQSMTGGYRRHVIFDTNPPQDDSWQCEWFEKDDGFLKVFKQPPGLIKDLNNQWITNPNAENLCNLAPNYYLDMVRSRTPESLKVYALGEYGSSQDGLPCYTQYNDSIHYSIEDLEPEPGYKLYCGWDYGTNPSFVICQVINGQLRILEEFTSERSNIRDFASNIIKPFLNANYAGYEIREWGDPSGNSNPGTDGFSCFQILRELGFNPQPARTNAIEPRLDSVRFLLNKLIDGKPALILSKKCKLLRKAFISEYQYEKIKVISSSNTIEYKDVPLKNMASHISDTLQYVCLHYNDVINASSVSSFKPNHMHDDWITN